MPMYKSLVEKMIENNLYILTPKVNFELFMM